MSTLLLASPDLFRIFLGPLLGLRAYVDDNWTRSLGAAINVSKNKAGSRKIGVKLP